MIMQALLLNIIASPPLPCLLLSWKLDPSRIVKQNKAFAPEAASVRAFYQSNKTVIKTCADI